MDNSLWENLHLKDTWDFQKDLEGISIYCQHEVTGTKFTFPSENKQKTWKARVHKWNSDFFQDIG